MSAERRDAGLGAQLDEVRPLGQEAIERARRILAKLEEQERDAGPAGEPAAEAEPG